MFSASPWLDKTKTYTGQANSTVCVDCYQLYYHLSFQQHTLTKWKPENERSFQVLWSIMNNLSCNYYHFNYPGSQHMGLFSATWLISLQRQVSCCFMMGQLDFASTNNPRWSLPPTHNQRSRETLRIDVTEKVFYSFPIVKCQIFFTGVSAFKQN